MKVVDPLYFSSIDFTILVVLSEFANSVTREIHYLWYRSSLSIAFMVK